MFKIICCLLLISIHSFVKTEDPEKLISNTNNEFSFKIFKMLSKEKNDVMSSLSILSALSILMNGAKGETQTDLIRFLEYSLQDTNQQNINEGMKLISEKYQNKVLRIKNFWDNSSQIQYQINMANRVICNEDIQLLPEFSKNVKEYFKGELQRADFRNNAVEETNKINDWVRNKTNNKINKIFDKLDVNTISVILNVIYFKGAWQKQFYEGQTQKLNFHNNGETPVKSDIMTNIAWYNYGDSSELDAQVLEMNYRGGDISFVVVLPKARNGLNSLKDKINAEVFERILANMTMEYTKVYLPKFKAEMSYDLMEVLNPKPIALTQNADLTAMTAENTIVSEIKHKVFIEVNEKGTEAAAVTAITTVIQASVINPNKMILFRANHPFLYFIRDKSNSMILFSGQINAL